MTRHIIIAALQIFITLRTIDDREVTLNVHEIVSITRPGGLLVEDANCLLGTTDGKFSTVVESCKEVIQKIKEAR